jgi:predicted O-methyltransferase YrrM
MSAATLLKAALPTYAVNWLRDRWSVATLAVTSTHEFDALALGRAFDVASVFLGPWAEDFKRLHDPIGDKSGGTALADRRALYYLVRHLQPRRVLEVGTHVGASTIYLASALRDNCFGRLTTVDIVDVKRFNPSPQAICRQLGLDVEFVVSDSVAFMQHHTGFDLVFLDGDHSAGTVYREVSAALRALSRGGYIILHDYYPTGVKAKGDTIIGPQIAMERIRRETSRIMVQPFGVLPWQPSQPTSLAAVGRA